jgi:hypothetical protein
MALSGISEESFQELGKELYYKGLEMTILDQINKVKYEKNAQIEEILQLKEIQQKLIEKQQFNHLSTNSTTLINLIKSKEKPLVNELTTIQKKIKEKEIYILNLTYKRHELEKRFHSIPNIFLNPNTFSLI